MHPDFDTEWPTKVVLFFFFFSGSFLREPRGYILLTGARGQSDTTDTATQRKDKDMQAHTHTQTHKGMHMHVCARVQ